MKSLINLLVALSAVLACATASAVNFYCDGKITSVGMNGGGGNLWVSYGQHGVQSVCSIGAPTSLTQADTCRGWLAMLLAAQAQGKTIRIYYDSVNGNPNSCSFQAWEVYKPHFLQTLD
jgi:hypothetical protein